MVTDYISRDSVLRAVVDAVELYPQEYDAITKEINFIPAADVAEVVRCKDCRFFFAGYNEKCCINHKGVVATDENGFCHHAERMTDND